MMNEQFEWGDWQLRPALPNIGDYVQCDSFCYWCGTEEITEGFVCEVTATGFALLNENKAHDWCLKRWRRRIVGNLEEVTRELEEAL